MTTSSIRVIYQVEDEVENQRSQWGEQNHPDGTGTEEMKYAAAIAKANCASGVRAGDLTWFDILTEEVLEAFAETDPDRIREELIQVAAVAVTWAEAIDRRTR